MVGPEKRVLAGFVQVVPKVTTSPQPLRAFPVFSGPFSALSEEVSKNEGPGRKTES